MDGQWADTNVHEMDVTVRVICASIVRLRGSVMDELLGMRRDVCAFNAALGLRSALLHSAGWFFQWHEGPAESVEKMLRVVQGDARNEHLRILHRSTGEPVLEELLQIATTHGIEKPTDVARRLHALMRGQAMEVPAEPAELWRQLAAPMLLKDAASAEAAMVRHNVVAITSEYTAAVDMVRQLGERHKSPVTYQRFATGEPRSTDVGAAYVDLPGAGHVTRLQALSRRSLAHPMVRLLLQQVHCVVLLLGTREEAAQVLAGDVAGLLQSLHVRPVLRLAAGSPASAAGARERLLGCSADIADVDASLLRASLPGELFGQLVQRHPGRMDFAAA